MGTLKIILRTAAFLLGGAAFVAVGVGAYVEFRGGPIGVISNVFIIPALVAGVLLLISWRREFARDPWIVPSAIFAACAFVYCGSLLRRIGFYDFALGDDSSWITLVLALLGQLIMCSVIIIVVPFVYHGTYAFLRSLRYP